MWVIGTVCISKTEELDMIIRENQHIVQIKNPK